MIFKKMKKKRNRIIERLRKTFGGVWSYDRGANQYIHHTSGNRVIPYSVLSPRYDGDDDTFRTELRWSHNHETAIYVW